MQKKINIKNKSYNARYGGELETTSRFMILQKKWFRVIEDAAHAFGTMRNNEIVGSFGDVSMFQL